MKKQFSFPVSYTCLSCSECPEFQEYENDTPECRHNGMRLDIRYDEVIHKGCYHRKEKQP